MSPRVLNNYSTAYCILHEKAFYILSSHCLCFVKTLLTKPLRHSE